MTADSGLTILQPMARVVDPHLTTDRRALLGIRFAEHGALVRRDAAGGFLSALAASWSLAPDARDWRFSLRDDIRFHDGSWLSARDVVASLERLRDPARGGELGTTGVIQGYLAKAHFEAIDSTTVRIVTATPLADLLDLIVDVPIVRETSGGALVGTGAYRVVDVTDDRVVMEAVDDYWAGPPSHGRVCWLAEPDAEARVDRLLAGEADLIADPAPARRAALAGADEIVHTDAPSGAVTAFLCNAFAGPCVDRRIRRALNLGLDKHALIGASLAGEGDPVNGPLTPLHLGHDPDTPPYPHDAAAARQLLREAGLGDGLDITVDVPTSLPDEAPLLARLMAEQLAAIGVSVTIHAHADRPAYAEMVRAKRIADAACFDSTPLSTFRVLREKCHGAAGGPWWQGYANPAVDRLLDAAAATVDSAERQAAYRRAYRLIRDDAPWLFLYSPRHHWAARPGRAWSPTPAGWIALV